LKIKKTKKQNGTEISKILVLSLIYVHQFKESFIISKYHVIVSRYFLGSFEGVRSVEIRSLIENNIVREYRLYSTERLRAEVIFRFSHRGYSVKKKCSYKRKKRKFPQKMP